MDQTTCTCNLSNVCRGLTKDLLCAFISKMAHKFFTRRIFIRLPNIYTGNTNPDPWWPLLSTGQSHLSNFGSRSPKENFSKIFTRFVCIVFYIKKTKEKNASPRWELQVIHYLNRIFALNKLINALPNWSKIKVDKTLTLKAPITTAADDTFCRIFPNFRQK